MSAYIKSVAKVSSGFQAAVNIKQNIDDDQKVSAFIPTQIASQILSDLALNFHPTSARKSRLITGTYGTGKSHLALVIARIFRDGSDNHALSPVFAKLNKWPSIAEKLIKERSSCKGKFLLVLLHGDQGDFKDELLYELDLALTREGLVDIFPDTAFTAASKKIDEIKQDYPEFYERLEKLVNEYDFVSVDALQSQLNRKRREAYDNFLKIHEALLAGTKFDKHHNINPEEVYKVISRKLVEEKGYAGIVVIWDEFGRYLERIAEEPHSKEGEAIQNFADGCCNLKGDAQVHLYLLCHRTLKEYGNISAIKHFTNISAYELDEWKKIEGRFTQFAVKTSSHEIFSLIDQVIIQDEESEPWKNFVKTTADYLDQETDLAKKYRIFSEFTREEIHTIVTLGCYPLHPMASYCLPLISQKVGQDNRTLFTFLSDSGQNTLGPFIEGNCLLENGSVPVFFTADMLWDYFNVDLGKDPIHKRVFSKYSQANEKVDPEDSLGKRIIKAIALLQIISSDTIQAKEDIISYCLALPASVRSTLKEKLKSFCLKESGESVLAQNLDGIYRFTGVVTDGFTSELEKTVEIRKIKPIIHLREIIDETTKFEKEIQATRYIDDFSIERHLTVEFISPAEMEDQNRWLENLGRGKYLDGYALYVICEDQSEIAKAIELIKTKINHPQLLIAVPKSGAKLSSYLKMHDAIVYLEKTNKALYGEGAPIHDEWKEHFTTFNDYILKEIEALLKPENEKMTWYLKGEPQENIRSKSQIHELASKIMFSVFDKTPKIVSEKLTTDEGPDTFRRYRQPIIDKLLLKEGPNLLWQETSTTHKNVIDNFYKRNGILRRISNSPEIEKPNISEYPNMNTVWGEVEAFLEKAKNNDGIPIPMTDIISNLRQPPYGLRARSIPLILAAILRKENLLGNISILDGTRRVDKITGDIIDKAVFSHNSYKLHYEAFGEKQKAILYGVAESFGLDTSKEKDKGELVAEIQDKFNEWWYGLSQFSQTTSQISKPTALVRETIFKKLIAEDSDIYKILMQELASRIPDDQRITETLIFNNFSKWKQEIENVVTDKLVPNIELVVCEVFGCTADKPWNEALMLWWNGLTPSRKSIRIPGDSGILSKICAEMIANDKESLVALAEKISTIELNNWKDSTLETFRGSLTSAKRAIDLYEDMPSIEVEDGGDKAPVVPPGPLPPGKVEISIKVADSIKSTSFIMVDNYSDSGKMFKNMLSSIIEGARSLQPGELETILLDIVKDYLK